MRKIRIDLPSLPQDWSSLTLRQFQMIESIRGKFSSTDAYLTHCFFALTGLKPLKYAERWRAVLGGIPLIGLLIKENGRGIYRMNEDYLGIEPPIPSFWQYYRFSGIWNALFGRRFRMEDQDVFYFQQRLNFLTERGDISLRSNPVYKKRIGLKNYTSYYSRLADMDWLDYNRCSMFIEQYIKTKNPSFLDNFLSAFYKIGNARKVRGKFSDMEIHLVLLFWNGCQQYFKKTFPHLYKENTKNSSKDYMKEESEITVFLSKEAHMKPDDVRGMRAFDALQYLETNAIICEQTEKQIKAIKSHR